MATRVEVFQVALYENVPMAVCDQIGADDGPTLTTVHC